MIETTKELEVRYQELLTDTQNTKTSAGLDAIAHARKEIQEELKSRGHHGFDYNC